MARKRPVAARTRTSGARRDPKFRHIDPSVSKVGLQNAREDKKYVFVNQGDPHTGVGHYKTLGYQVEEYNHETDVHLKSVTPELGQPPEKAGSILMSIDRERADEIEEFGEDGDTGQTGADEQERQIVSKRGGVDELRGLHRYLQDSHAGLEGDIDLDE